MKKLLAVLSLSLTATSAFADGHWGGYHGGHGGYGGGYYHSHGYNDFVGPAILGGIVGYAIAQPRYVSPPPTVIYQQPPVIYQQPQTQYQNCTAWTETVDQYGNVTRTRTCY